MKIFLPLLLALSIVADASYITKPAASGGGGSGNIATINTDSTADQTLAVGTSGTDFAIVDDAAGGHTFNLPSASATARGLMTTGTQTIAGAKTFSGGLIAALTGNASTASALFANPSDCASDTYATTIAANGNLTCASVTNASTTAASANTGSAIVARDGSGNFSAGTITAALSGNASTATALAANPADCASNTFANAIAASGDLSCVSVPNAATTATSSNTNSTIVARDGSGNFSAGTITAALTGNASTATALAADPADCSAGSFATAINASGTLTCSNPFTGLIESYSGHVETVANKTYVIDEYSSVAKQVVNIRIECASGTVTVALKIGGTNITTCNGISVSSTPGTTTCDTGVTNDLASTGRLTLVTTANSSCVDMSFTIKTSRD